MVAADARARIEALKTQIQEKIQRTLAEFAEGKLSREQFHAIYEHYNGQLELMEQANHSGNAELVAASQGQTIGIRRAHMGKAVGLMIYHNKSGMFVDTLGSFEVSSSRIAPTLNDMTMMMEAKRLIDRRVEKLGERQWLLFAAGKHTSVVTLFEHEPSQEQSREIERLHHDFEVANEAMLSAGLIDPSKLAYPFLVFVQRKLTRS